MTKKKRQFDVRTIERYLRDDIVSREDYEEHVENLPDVADKAEKMEAEFVEGVLLDEEQNEDEEGDDDIEGEETDDAD